ncbi:MAG: MmgE/PrpD family protein [Betaproteobacteria bacterium]|nr:MmgE/PrpD family protein [Betaproteobacteria bacterium]
MKQVDNRAGATEKLTRFVTETSYNTLSAEVIAAAKVGILDGIANMLAGATQPLAAIIGAYLKQLGGNPQCAVVGQDFRTNAPLAAFANGIFLHCLDFEIQGQPVAHGTSNILPSALALGEICGAPGTRLIEAYVIGWEIHARLRRASARCDTHGYHPPGLLGPLAAAAASAKMLGLDTAGVRMALGIAASHTGGLTANTGTMVKSTHPGTAAREGVEAALLAQAGFLSRDGILEVKQGFVDTVLGAEFDWDELTRDLGTAFALVNPGFNIKRYPAQIFMQWAIEAALTLRLRHPFRPEDITYLELEVPGSHVRPGQEVATSGLDGKFDFAYCGAVAVADGRVDIDSFSDATRFSPRVESVLQKVRIKRNPGIPRNPPDTWAVARVGLQDGRVLSETCRHYRGSIANPMDREERLAKLRDCAKRSLEPADVERVIGMAEALDSLPDLRPLMLVLGHRSVK